MLGRLAPLIAAFQREVATAVSALAESGIAIPRTSLEWATQGIPSQGVLVNGGRYVKHGFGCVVVNEGRSIDFDFGPSGETWGFDAWRLWNFACGDRGTYGYSNESEIADDLHESIAIGSIVEHPARSGYYLLLADRERAQPTDE